MHKASLIPLVALVHTTAVIAATVTYNWEVTWVWASPDGYSRPIIGINYGWPCPIIQVFLGDTVVVNLVNKLGNETSGIHFHGINQINSNFMDGSVGSCQCPLPPDYSITYSFIVRLEHSSSHFQYLGNKLTRDLSRLINRARIGVSNCSELVQSTVLTVLGKDHSHNMGQYPDGFRGPLIVHNPEDPYLDDYEDDQLLTVSDW
jgi:iron transport multicopper oxidase